MDYHKKLSKILRTDLDVIYGIEKFLGEKTNKLDALKKIVEENDRKAGLCLENLGLSRTSSAKMIFDALIKKISEDDKKISEMLGNPQCDKQSGCEKIIDFIKEIGLPKGFFLKKERFIEILKKEPPKRIIRSLGYKDVNELIENEDINEIAAALRFMEGGEWINEKLLPNYEEFTKDDFEERDVVMIAISEKWKKAAETFIKKKYHNISHLKELGIIFIIPTELNLEGEIIRSISLLLHYTHEIEFYTDLFLKMSNDNDFSSNLIKLLRGDIIEDRSSLSENDWLIVQRYLAKIDEFDWRLFYPHVNPEAIHWEKAERDIAQLGIKHEVNDLAFWNGLNWVGDYFGTDLGVDVLVSFNIVDNAMSLVKEKEMIKYLYHHQEALWNKIFSEYFGEKKMEEMIKENILKGKISL